LSTELEKKVTVSMDNTHLLQMYSLSESLVYYEDAIEGNAAVLSKLRSLGGQIGFQARHFEFLDDIILEKDCSSMLLEQRIPHFMNVPRHAIVCVAKHLHDPLEARNSTYELPYRGHGACLRTIALFV
jgi:hypothetical protein